MADVRAFRAYRYDLGRVGALGDVVAPPYDVIDAELQQRLYDRSPYNVIRLILNKELATDTEADNRYTRAAACLRDWQRDDVLVQDSARALYVYHQDFEVEGRRYTRKGFMARVRLEPFGTGRIYPHEETMAGPKADRLKLFRATAMNLSPVFGLYPDPRGEVQALLDRAVGRALPLEATDHLGVVSRLWPVTDQHVVAQPVAQGGGGARVAVVRVAVARLLLIQDQADDVVGAAGVQGLLKAGVDHIIGRRDHIAERSDAAQVVAVSAEGADVGHVRVLPR